MESGDRVLESLGIRTAQPSEVEHDVLQQIEDELLSKEQEKINEMEEEVADLKHRLTFLEKRVLTKTEEKEKAIMKRKIKTLQRRLGKSQMVQKQVHSVMAGSEDATDAPREAGAGAGDGSWYDRTETDRGRMIRLGHITPFSDMQGMEKAVAPASSAGQSHVTAPDGLARATPSTSRPAAVPFRASNAFSSSSSGATPKPVLRLRPKLSMKVPRVNPSIARAENLKILKQLNKEHEKILKDQSDSGRLPSKEPPQNGGRAARKVTSRARVGRMSSRLKDDATDNQYEERVEEWNRGRRLKRLRQINGKGDEDVSVADAEEEEELDELQAHAAAMTMDGSGDAEEEVVEFDGGYRLPSHLYYQLFEFQQTGVKWMWELYCLGAGGIIADEMGLGKTIQSVAFLAGLYHSKLVKAPSLVICPATIMNQWVREFHKWWPPVRVCVLHSTGTFEGSRKALFRDIARRKGVVITSYGTAKACADLLLRQKFEMVFLDEGHKIKNPNAGITLMCKQLRSTHRMILTGAPIQNNLIELWSLFDFVYPGKLGTLPVFETEFAIPITMGGYANASRLQVQISYKCAVILRDLINPYLLRRMKDDVDIGLPSKQERVLFCPLVPEQVAAYEAYLKSDDVNYVLAQEKSGKNMLKAVTALRKICNHPDMLLPASEIHNHPSYGGWPRSGKMKVIEQLLPLWKEEGHRVLWFTQTRRMLEIMEIFAQEKNYKYLKMDGNTSIGARAQRIDKFNEDPSYFLFLLTTRTGGLGINLTGADRVLIYDPDWNPSTDSQARERAWRIGQEKEVAVYRLITSGTVEEKIYQRQIYKQFLTNKILKDPRQKRFFHSRVMRDLFTLTLTAEQGSETGDIFSEIKGEKTHDDFHDGAEGGSGGDGGRNGGGGAERQDEDEEMAGAGSANLGGSAVGVKRTVSEALEGAAEQEGPSKKRRLASPVPAVDELLASLAKEDALEREEEDSDEDEAAGAGVPGRSNEDNILAQLFSSKGIKSVLEHDAIMEQANPDHMFVENEASQVAQRAARLLKTSRSRCDKEKVYVPTWTGRSGAAGGPPPESGRRSGGKPRYGTQTNTSLQHFSTRRQGPRQADKVATIRNFQQQAGVRRLDAPPRPLTWASASVTADASGGMSSGSSGSAGIFGVIPADVRRHAAAQLGAKRKEAEQRPKEPVNTKQTSITNFFSSTTAPVGPAQMSSASVLDKIRARTGKPAAPAEDDEPDTVDLTKDDSENLEHIQLLHSFLLMNGGKASSDAIIQKFGVQLISREAKFVFRSMLKEIASFDRRTQLWALKPAYQ